MPGNSYPINLHQTLLWKVRNFPEFVYNFNSTDQLTTLMSVLLGNAGTGQLSNLQLAARLNQQNMEFSDLDNILGVILNSPRLPEEIYTESINPFTQQLSQSQWEEVQAKDSAYRERLNGIASALLKGPTVLGVQTISEAVSQVKFKTIEAWNTVASGVTTPTVLASGVTTRGFGNNEIILVPLVPSGIAFNSSSISETYQSVNQLKPIGIVITIASGINNFTSINYTVSSNDTNSEYFSFERQVTGAGVAIPDSILSTGDPSITSRYWVQNNQSVSAPHFAHLQTQESMIDLTGNISSVNTKLYATRPDGVVEEQDVNTTLLPVGNPRLRITSTVYGG